MRCHAALALVAVLGLWAGPVLAASLAVVNEGDGVYAYELVLEPGEVVAGIQLDLITSGAALVVEDTGWPVPVRPGSPIGEIEVINPWNLVSSVAPVASGAIRVLQAWDQGGNRASGVGADSFILPSGTDITYFDFVDGRTCPLGAFVCFLDFEPTGIPVARLLVEQGPAPTLYTAGVCVPAAGATCSFPETNVPEPVVLVLLAPLGLLLVTRRNTAG